jgi:hypothetical protein
MPNDISEAKATIIKKATTWIVENFKLVLAFGIGFIIGALIMM